nr:MAG TPA: hypothetical protein [Bacteriophage sp.]
MLNNGILQTIYTILIFLLHKVMRLLTRLLLLI